MNSHESLIPPYQGLMSRYISNFGTQWQVFALGLAAQGFVVGAASQVVGRVFTSILLALLILFIGCATVISSLRISLFAAVDRHMLDEYEKVLLGEEYQHLRLRHANTLIEREELLSEEVRHQLRRPSGVRGFVPTRLIRVFGPTLWWVVLEGAVSIVGASIPILGIFRL
ncbi:hypothetical protein ACIA8G_18920 [Lentzea sp. NPDC051213]|uniref:hypothetical protein n=1 Tax=Lentzea sp. NPDC051213 TaxID=3364126 RepID=UPI0037B68204